MLDSIKDEYHVGVSGRTFTVDEPGGAVDVAIQYANRLPKYVANLTLFAHHSVCSDFPQYTVEGTGMLSETLPYGILWEQMVVPTLGFRRGIDVLFCPNALCPLRDTEFPVVVAIQDIPEYHGFGSKKYIWFREQLLPRIVNRADRIVTVSEFMKRDISNHLDVPLTDIDVVYNGINDIYLDKSSEGQAVSLPEQYILFVGAKSERKNLVGAIDAFNRFKQRHGTNHSLAIVGPSKNTTYNVIDINSLSKSVKDNIYNLGYLSRAELKFVYSNADAFLFPSKHESFGLPPLEAAACGTPVVTTKTGAIPEILDDSVRFVDSEDPDKIADGIAWAVFDPNTNTAVKRAKERVTEFTWERATRKLVSILNETAQAH